MSGRRIFYILFLTLIVVILARPRGTWKEFRRIWNQREWMLKVLVTIIGVYFIYGLYLYFTGQVILP